MRQLLILALLIAPAAHAETYKWVDERGVVNYSNTPPPAAAKATHGIADRVSIIESDPALKRIAYSPTPYELMLQQEWLQRQRLMAERENLQAAYPPIDPYYRSMYPGFFPVATVRPVRRVRATALCPDDDVSLVWRRAD